jgi:hypothetical protein
MVIFSGPRLDMSSLALVHRGVVLYRVIWKSSVIFACVLSDSYACSGSSHNSASPRLHTMLRCAGGSGIYVVVKKFIF